MSFADEKSVHFSKDLHQKLCRKIAYLVNVIDKLFRENHDYQLQNVSLREELTEMSLLRTENASLRGEIDAMKKLIHDLEQAHARELEEMKRFHEQELNDVKCSYQTKLSELKETLRSQNHLMKEMERNLGKKTVERKELMKRLNDLDTRLEKYEEIDIARMTSRSKNLEIRLEAARKRVGELEEENKRLTDSLEKLLASNKSLEAELGDARSKNKILRGQIKVMETRERNQKQHKPLLLPMRKEFPADVFMNSDLMDELEYLRGEVLRYRLELANRENNFNRMFVQHSTLTVDHQGRRSVSFPRVDSKSSSVQRKGSVIQSSKSASKFE